MLCNKITLYYYILNFFKGKLLYTIFIMQYDNIYETKENKKDINWKIQNLITSTQTRVPNNTKIHQSKVNMQEKCKKKSTKNGKKKMRERKREK